MISKKKSEESQMLASSDQELFVSIPILLALFIITRKRFNTLELNFFGLQKTKKLYENPVHAGRDSFL